MAMTQGIEQKDENESGIRKKHSQRIPKICLSSRISVD